MRNQWDEFGVCICDCAKILDCFCNQLNFFFKIMKAIFNSSFERDFRSNILKAYWFKFFRNMHFFSAVMVVFFTLWGKISFTEIMILQAVYTFSVFLLEVPTGVVADRLGRKTSLILAGVTGTVAPLVYVSYPNFWVFALAEVVWAIGGALLSGADSALIYDSLKSVGDEKESKKVLARYGSFGLAGILVAAPIGSLIASKWGVAAPMLFTVIPMTIALGISFTFKEPKKYKEKKAKSYLATLRDGVKYLRGHKSLRILMVDHIGVGTLAFFMIWIYQLVLQDYGVAIGYFGFIHAGIVVAQIIVLNNIARLEKIFGGKKKYLNYSAFLVGALFLVLALVDNVYVAVMSLFLIGAFGMTRKSLYGNYMNKFIESHHRATVLSVIAMGYSFSMAIIDVILGRIVDWNLEFGLGLVGALVILFSVFSKLEDEHLLD